MFKIINQLFRIADGFAVKIKIAFVFSFFEGVFLNMPIFGVFFIINKIMLQRITLQDVWVCSAIVIGGVLLQYLFRYLVLVYQSASGYHIFEKERIRIGDKFKRFPMGFFTEDSMGHVSSVVTTDFTFIETWVVFSIDKVVKGCISATVGLSFLLYMDYRIALINLVIISIAIVVLNKIQKVGREQSVIRQKTSEELVSAVLEYVQGISVIKAFNLTNDKSRATHEAFIKTRDNCIAFEKKFIPPNMIYELCFSTSIAVTVCLSMIFAVKNSLSISTMLMLVIFIFHLYTPLNALGVFSANLRIMEAALKRYEDINSTAIIDENGTEPALNNYDIEFENVSFAYNEKDIIKDINFSVPEKSMTALVGSSGGGKTTIVNLIARFWDVQKGSIRIGGMDVKDMTCEGLLSHVSMVFQDVYLFNDTIMNNIRFGNPDATEEEVVNACIKARCHDFIIELENGYNTVVGEGGSTLSGGEKQRISIARAILKDAPIILLDEATASVDPDNEKHIQIAINELVKDKTLIMIAHRLSTIKNADQILVIDNGRIIQKGTHHELIEEKGQYHDFWKRRMRARSWKINTAID